MAIPFYIPEQSENGETSTTSSTQTSPINSPSRPRSDSQSPQQSPIDNEILVQAFYEALCRCSQG